MEMGWTFTLIVIVMTAVVLFVGWAIYMLFFKPIGRLPGDDGVTCLNKAAGGGNTLPAHGD